MVTQSERDWAKYEDRFKAELDARSFQKVHEETGLQKGLQKGLQQGLAQGDLIGRIHLAQKLLQQPQTPREELLALPMAELERLGELLEQQVMSGFRPSTGTA